MKRKESSLKTASLQQSLRQGFGAWEVLREGSWKKSVSERGKWDREWENAEQESIQVECKFLLFLPRDKKIRIATSSPIAGSPWHLLSFSLPPSLGSQVVPGEMAPLSLAQVSEEGLRYKPLASTLTTSGSWPPTWREDLGTTGLLLYKGCISSLGWGLATSQWIASTQVLKEKLIALCLAHSSSGNLHRVIERELQTVGNKY